MDIVKGSGRNQVVHKKVMPFPTGYGVLPEPGGLMDQPNRTMTYFDIFISEERRVFYEQLQK